MSSNDSDDLRVEDIENEHVSAAAETEADEEVGGDNSLHTPSDDEPERGLDLEQMSSADLNEGSRVEKSPGRAEALVVVLKGGSPWGFTLNGGSEVRSPIKISEVCI